MKDMHSICFVEFRGRSSQEWFAVDLSKPELGLCMPVVVVVERMLVGVGRTPVVVDRRLVVVVGRTTVVAVPERRLAAVVERTEPELDGMPEAGQRTGAVNEGNGFSPAEISGFIDRNSPQQGTGRERRSGSSQPTS